MDIDNQKYNPNATKQEDIPIDPPADPSHADSSTGGFKQEQETKIKLEDVTDESLWDTSTCLKTFLPDDDFPDRTFLYPPDQRKKAAAFALEQARALSQHNRQDRKDQDAADRANGDASSGSDDDKPFAPPPKSFRIDKEEDEKLEEYQHFIESLPFCPMDVGFDVEPSKAETDKSCYCPCHDKLKRWREKFGVRSDRCDGDTKSFASSGLIDHLEVMAFGQGKRPPLLSYGRVAGKYHWFVLCYLDALYANDGGPGIKHKAFYKVGDKGYKNAVQAEARKRQSEMDALKKALENERRMRAELDEKLKKMDEAIKLSPDIDIKHEYEIRQGLFVTLGVAANSREGALHEESETRYKDQFDSHIELWQNRLDAARHDGNPLQVENVPVANFCLTDVFEKWSSPKCKDAAFLFSCIDQQDVGRFLNKWMVYYQAATDATAEIAEAAQRETKRLKSDPHKLNVRHAVKKSSFTGEDAGGLTRNFLSDLWLHLGTLECDGVLLFEDEKKHLKPQTDDFLKLKFEIKKNLKGTVKSSTYYEAVGRVVAYCIGQKLPLASHILPDLYKFYLLKGMSPKDPEYPIRDLIIHTCDLLNIAQTPEMTLDFIMADAQQYFDEDEESGSQKTLEARFRSFAHDRFIAQRSVALKALTAGITLNGHLKLSTCFLMPLTAINKFLFCHATVRVEDVLGALVPRYSRTGSMTNATQKSLEYQKRVLSKDSVSGEVSGLIVDFIKESTEEELQDFIWFVTGWRYFPRSGLTITVEFNYDETEPDFLPIAHTCTQDLKLPGWAYFAKKDELKEKLKTSIASVRRGSHFDMN